MVLHGIHSLSRNQPPPRTLTNTQTLRRNMQSQSPHFENPKSKAPCYYRNSQGILWPAGLTLQILGVPHQSKAPSPKSCTLNHNPEHAANRFPMQTSLNSTLRVQFYISGKITKTTPELSPNDGLERKMIPKRPFCSFSEIS